MAILESMESETTLDAGPPRSLLAVLLAATVLLHVFGLGGPLHDGQRGNCGAMFSLFARNVEAVGWASSGGVPIVNPVPPAPDVTKVFYTHHPPGLPWLVNVAAMVAGEAIVSARIVALLLTLCSVWLLADIVTRAAGPAAGLAAGALLAALPSGWHHGVLVNYETVALPALLLVVRVTVLGRGSPWLAGALAGLTDFIALVPLLLAPRSLVDGGERGRLWRRTLAAGVFMVLAWALAARQVAPGSLVETLHQALRTTPFAPDFTWTLWRDAAHSHLGSLYGWALAPGALGLLTLPWQTPRLRRLLLTLVGVGAFNVLVFGRHAIGHEHFWLILSPGIATAVAICIPAKTSRSAGLVRTIIVVAVLSISAWQALGEREARSQTRQSALGSDLAALTPPQTGRARPTIYVAPRGVPLVFLSASARYAANQPVSDRPSARAVADALRARLGLAEGDVMLVVPNDEQTPEWALALPVTAASDLLTLRRVTDEP